MGILKALQGGSSDDQSKWSDVPIGLRLMVLGNIASSVANNQAPGFQGYAAMDAMKQDAKQKRLRENYANKIQDRDPERAELIRQGLVDPSEFIKGDMALELERKKAELDPKNQFLKMIMGGGQPAPETGAGAVPASPGAPATGPTPDAPGATNTPQPIPQPAVQPGVNPNMARAAGIPDLTLAESKQLEAAAVMGNFDVALRQIQEQRAITQRQAAQQTQELDNQTKNNAENLSTAYNKEVGPETTAINVATQIEQLAKDIPSMSGSSKIAALYKFVKMLDELGAVREGDVALVQSAAPILDNLVNLKDVLLEGSPASDAAVTDIANTIGAMGQIAKETLTKKQIKYNELAKARGIPIDMVIGQSSNKARPGIFDVGDRFTSDRVVPKVSNQGAEGKSDLKPRRWNPQKQEFE